MRPLITLREQVLDGIVLFALVAAFVLAPLIMTVLIVAQCIVDLVGFARSRLARMRSRHV